jgi:tape measure domain-containing protein
MADYTLSAKGTYDGTSFNKGIAQSGSQLDAFKGKCSAISVALGNLLSGAVQKVGSAISGSVDSAISRVDTMNNFSKVMSNMGISADDANEAIKTLSGDALKGLPTTLDSAVSGVQRLTSKNQDVKKSTDYFLAMNNAIVAGGTDMGIQQSAIEQLSQAYAKGRMDMNEWRAIQQAMPAQLNQVAKAMGMTTDELGEGLRKGSVSMDSFMDTLVKLNKEGVEGFASLEEQARSATGGIATQMTNMNTAVTRAVANVIDKFNSTGAVSKSISLITNGIDHLGKVAAPVAEVIGKRFSSGLDAFKARLDETGDPLKAFEAGITTAFKGTPIEGFAKAVGKFVASISADIRTLAPIVKSVLSVVKDVASGVISAIGSISPATVKGIALAVAVTAAILKVVTVVKTLKTALIAATAAITPVQFAVAAVVTVLALLATGFMEIHQKSENFKKATTGLRDAVRSLGDESGAAAGGIGQAGSAMDDASGMAQDYALSVDELIQKQGELADSISKRNADVNTSNAMIQMYADKILELAGNCGGSAEKVAELQVAIDGYNEATGSSISMTDDFTGAVDVSTEALQRNTEAIKLRAKIAANEENLKELYKQQAEAMKTVEQATADANAAHADLANAQNNIYMDAWSNEADAAAAADKNLADAEAALAAVNGEIENVSDSLMNDMVKSMQKTNAGIVESINANDTFKAKLGDLGISVDGAAQQLSNLGFTAEQTAAMSEEQFAAMAGSADLSLSEIVQRCDELGIEMPTSLRGAVSASKDVMNQGGTEAASSWIMGMTSQQYAVVANAAATAGMSTSQFVAQASQMGAAGKDDVISFANGILAGKSTSDAAAGMTGASASGTLDANSDGSPAGSKLSGTFSSSINTNAGDGRARAMVTSAKSSAESIGTSSIGSNFSSGAASGINVSAMVSGAVQMVRNAIAAANREADSHSPSRVMKRFGRFFAQGAAIGVEEDSDLMAENTVSMVRGAISSVKRMPSPNLGTLAFSGATLNTRASTSIRSNRSGAANGYDAEMLLSYLYNEVADLNASLGRKIADNAPVVVESERQAARRYRRAQYA